MNRYSAIYTIKRRNNLCVVWAVLLSVLVSGCNNSGQPGQDVLASFGSKELLREEVDYFLPQNLSVKDSMNYARQYIEKWVRNQAIVEEAKKEIDGLDKRLKYKMQNYEAELIANEYAQDLIQKNQKKFLVTDGDILNYYTKFPERFISNSTFYQFFYVKTDLPSQWSLKTLMQSSEPAKIDELRAWARDNASEFRLDSSYVQDSEIDRIAKGFYQKGNIRKANKDVAYMYLSKEAKQTYTNIFRLLHVVNPGDQLPLRICRDRIIKSIKNQRINTLIQQAEASLVQSARKSKKVNY